jgi:hypothetical protein
MADDFSVQIDWSGFDEVRAALRQATQEVLAAVTRAQVENTEDLLGEAIKQAPVDEGTLRGSGSARVNRGQTTKSVMQTDEQGNITHSLQAVEGSDIGSLIDIRGNAVIEGEVGFNTPYAAQQHEHTEYRHPQGGKAKYLEDPLKERTPKYVENIAQGIREVTKD